MKEFTMSDIISDKIKDFSRDSLQKKLLLELSFSEIRYFRKKFSKLNFEKGKSLTDSIGNKLYNCTITKK